ncbi:hypothetical protein SL042_002213 [Enterococcus faecalis]|nr:hypothetical protein [Enterococcus faecalis]
MAYTFKSIKNTLNSNGLSTGIFDFSYQNKKYTLLFSFVNEQDKAVILFAKVGTQNTLTLPIDHDFTVATFISKQKYKELKLFFEIPYSLDSPPFKPIELFKTIDSSLKYRPISSSDSRQERSSIYRVQNPNAIYYNYMIDWDLKSGNRHYSQFNRQKVQVLIPDLFNKIRDKNISVFFQEEPSSPEEENSAIRIDLNQFDFN